MRNLEKLIRRGLWASGRVDPRFWTPSPPPLLNPGRGYPSLPSPPPRLGWLFAPWKGVSSRSELVGSLWGALGAPWKGPALLFRLPFCQVFEKTFNDAFHCLVFSKFIKKQVPNKSKNLQKPLKNQGFSMNSSKSLFAWFFIFHLPLEGIF